jgi:uncharacterized protein
MAARRRGRSRRQVTRRSFLQGSAAASALVLAGCEAAPPGSASGDDGEGGAGGQPGPGGKPGQSGKGGAGGTAKPDASASAPDASAPADAAPSASDVQVMDRTPPPEDAPPTAGKLPTRLFGRATKVPVSILGLGGWPMGLSAMAANQAQKLWDRAIDEGITYIDSAENYGSSHARLREILQRRRKEVVVVTKISSAVTMASVEGILRSLGVDYLDGLHLHNYGGRTWGNALAVLKQAKQQGLVRNIGLSGHQNAAAFLPAIRSGDIDLVMNPLNWVDRNAYTFETDVRQAAKLAGTNVVAMKVWGGPADWQGARTLVDASFAKEYIDDSLRYSLGLPDVVAAVIGIKNEAELMQAIEVARSYKPLAPDRLESMLAAGKTLSARRGQFFG